MAAAFLLLMLFVLLLTPLLLDDDCFLPLLAGLAEGLLLEVDDECLEEPCLWDGCFPGNSLDMNSRSTPLGFTTAGLEFSTSHIISTLGLLLLPAEEPESPLVLASVSGMDA